MEEGKPQEDQKLQGDTSASYGTIPDANKLGSASSPSSWQKLGVTLHATTAFKASFRTVKESLDMYQAPMTLFAGTWGSIASILIPLMAAQLTIVKLPGVYLCRCSDPHLYPDAFTFQHQLCDATFAAATLFPTVSCYIAVMLVSWRFAYQRLFNVLLSNHIALHFSRYSLKLATVLSIVVQVLLLSLACVHFFLKLKDGYLNGDTSDAMKNKILHNKINEVLYDPMLLLQPQNKNALTYLAALVAAYITPAALAIVFTVDAGDIDKNLIPLTQLLEQSPTVTVEHLDNSILLPEDVAEDVLKEGDWTECSTPEEVCEKLMERSLVFGSVHKLSVDHAEATSSGLPAKDFSKTITSKKTFLLGERGIWNVITDRWWPLHIILKPEPYEKVIPKFATLWTLHCCIMIGTIFYFISLRIKGLQASYVETVPDNRISSFVWYAIPAVAFICVLLLTAGALLLHACMILNEMRNYVVSQASIMRNAISGGAKAVDEKDDEKALGSDPTSASASTSA